MQAHIGVPHSLHSSRVKIVMQSASHTRPHSFTVSLTAQFPRSATTGGGDGLVAADGAATGSSVVVGTGPSSKSPSVTKSRDSRPMKPTLSYVAFSLLTWAIRPVNAMSVIADVVVGTGACRFLTRSLAR